jgi:Spy/CpxP family protein refolding chaperone
VSRRVLICAGAVWAAAAGALAQPANRPPREEAFKMIDAYVVSNLQESLGLTDEQFGKAVPLVSRLHKDRRELARRRMEALQEMRRLLGSGNATEAKVVEALKAVKAAEAEERAGVQRDLEALEAVLTPVQQAKYRLLEIEVDRKIRELMAQLRGQRTPAGRRRLQPNAQP